VLVDVREADANIDPELIERAITPNTRVILPVHISGEPCDMDAIMDIANRHELEVVEDCAQAIGASYRGKRLGTFGAAGCFSFFPSKNLGCCGDGGVVTTNRTDLFERIEVLRRHGGKVKYRHTELGLNTRLDEVQAAVLRIKLPHLAKRNALRRQVAATYDQSLGEIPQIARPPGPEDSSEFYGVYNQYTVLVPNRSATLDAMGEAGVGCAVYYPVPLHMQKVHTGLGCGPGSFPHAERVADRCLSLPMSPELEHRQARDVTEVLRLLITRNNLAA
jgi:dTDP-4-amino-4,6-dideoxygalactose transaminase